MWIRVQVMRLCLRPFVSAELVRAILVLDFCLWTEISWGKAEDDDEEEVEEEEETITPLKPVISSREEGEVDEEGERGKVQGSTKSSSKDLAVGK